MPKLNRKKIAVTLAFAALFGNKTSAMNSKYETSSFSTQKSSKLGAEISNPRGTLNIRSDSSGNEFFNWVKSHKAVSVAVPSVVVAAAVGLTIWGVKHKNKDNQNPGGQKPGEQNTDDGEKNDQVPPPKIDVNDLNVSENDNSKENLPPNNQQNVPQQQLIQKYGKYVGAQNAQAFCLAVAQAAGSGVQLTNNFLNTLLSHLGSDFPAIIGMPQLQAKLQNFSLLAKLKEQDNVNFNFGKNQNGFIFLTVFIDDFAYNIYEFGSNQTVFCGRYINGNWQDVDKMVIENGKLTAYGLPEQQSQ